MITQRAAALFTNLLFAFVCVCVSVTDCKFQVKLKTTTTTNPPPEQPPIYLYLQKDAALLVNVRKKVPLSGSKTLRMFRKVHNI